jgi:hypothetical protein
MKAWLILCMISLLFAGLIQSCKTEKPKYYICSSSAPADSISNIHGIYVYDPVIRSNIIRATPSKPIDTLGDSTFLFVVCGIISPTPALNDSVIFNGIAKQTFFTNTIPLGTGYYELAITQLTVKTP